MNELKLLVRVTDGRTGAWADARLTPSDLKLSLEDFTERYLKPAFAQVKSIMDDQAQ